MKVSADIINGVMAIKDYKEIHPEFFHTVDDEDIFYAFLGDMRPDDLILVADISLKMAKKIHREYGIKRF